MSEGNVFQPKVRGRMGNPLFYQGRISVVEPAAWWDKSAEYALKYTGKLRPPFGWPMTRGSECFRTYGFLAPPSPKGGEFFSTGGGLRFTRNGRRIDPGINCRVGRIT